MKNTSKLQTCTSSYFTRLKMKKILTFSIDEKQIRSQMTILMIDRLINNFPQPYLRKYTKLNCQVLRKVKYCLRIATVHNTTYQGAFSLRTLREAL